jgi:hypothetical protein
MKTLGMVLLTGIVIHWQSSIASYFPRGNAFASPFYVGKRRIPGGWAILSAVSGFAMMFVYVGAMQVPAAFVKGQG